MTPACLELSGEDRLLSLVGDVATIRSAHALPVGRRVDVSLGPEAGPPAEGKVIDVVREREGFRLRVRLQSLARRRREALVALLPGDGP